MMRKPIVAALGAASLLIAACGPTESGTLTLKLEHEDCRQRDSLQSAGWIEVTVSGPGMADVVGAGPRAGGGLELGEIPAGSDREVVARAKISKEKGAATVAVGRSAKFEVVADQDLEVPVPMIGLNQVHPTATAANECTTLSGLRAGHSSAAFSDGRVLLFGGFVLNESGEGPKFTYLDTVELYEPATGGFRPLPPVPAICGPDKNQSCARAFAPAVVQPTNKGERFLAVGGEYRDEAGHPLSLGDILSYDPVGEEWTTIELQEPRRHHTATLLDNGTLFIIGGLGNPETAGGQPPVVAPTELLGKGADLTSPGKVSVQRAFHGAVAHVNETFIAGGMDGDGGLPVSVLRIAFTSIATQTLSEVADGDIGSNGVIGPSLTVHAQRLVVAGGLTPEPNFPNNPDLLANVPELGAGPVGNQFNAGGKVIPLAGVSGQRSFANNTFPLKENRSFACTARIDDNSFLVAGGLSTSGKAVVGTTVEVLTWVDESLCEPDACTADTECGSPSKCDLGTGKCRLACTDDAACGAKGACNDRGYCQADPKNPDHRCSGAVTSCFKGAKCVEDGKFDVAHMLGGPTSSKLIDGRAWGSCTKLSPDQILISGGLSDANYPITLGSAEIYEIMRAGR